MSKELALARRCGVLRLFFLFFSLVSFPSSSLAALAFTLTLNNCIFPNTQTHFYILSRVFREFLWLSKRCSRSISEHRAKTEEVKRTIRTSLFAAARKNEKKKKNDDDEFIAAERALEDEIVKFLLGKVGFLKMNASGSVSRELRSREERKSGRKETVLSTTFVLRGGELVPTRGEEGVDVESKGSRVNDGKLSNEEAWTYHNRLMKRQYYGKTPPKMPEPF
jgi:hypothetical protein